MPSFIAVAQLLLSQPMNFQTTLVSCMLSYSSSNVMLHEVGQHSVGPCFIKPASLSVKRPHKIYVEFADSQSLYPHNSPPRQFPTV